MGYLHAISVHPSFTQLSPEFPRLLYTQMQHMYLGLSPQLIIQWLFSSWPSVPLLLHPSSRGDFLPCVPCVLHTYIDHIQSVPLLHCGGHLPGLEQQRSFVAQGSQVHSTKGLATSKALFKWVSVNDFCAAASWSSPYTFVHFYHLDETVPIFILILIRSNLLGLWCTRLQEDWLWFCSCSTEHECMSHTLCVVLSESAEHEWNVMTITSLPEEEEQGTALGCPSGHLGSVKSNYQRDDNVQYI